ncbi:MAG: hypothetical protein ACREPG_11395, partial [Candidatus Binatia bacterium]
PTVPIVQAVQIVSDYWSLSLWRHVEEKQIGISLHGRLLKNPSESFDGLRTDGSETEIVEKIPFMLSPSTLLRTCLSKHVPHFSASK